ncbi:MAG: GTPase [Nanoarchaeota archaeon]|nr:GTPase [Nanoarchaeota archaeon]
MTEFWKIVNKVIRDSDVILLVLDSRLVKETRHPEIEEKVRKTGKPLIYVLNKCDLVKKEEIEKLKNPLKPAVFISAKDHLGTTKLRECILIEAKRAKIEFKTITVGVLGYPNVGKSSIINAMKGKHSASTSSMSGHTKSLMKIRGDNRIMFLDTPGVLPYREKDAVKHAFIGTVDFVNEKDPDIMAMKLMAKYPGLIEHHYQVEPNTDREEVLEQIAIKKMILKKGKEPDLARTGRMILQEWQKGKIRPKDE